MVSTNSPRSGQSIVLLKPTSVPGIPANELENGVLTVNGQQFSILGNHSVVTTIPRSFGGLAFENAIIVEGPAPAVPANTVCTFTDDDDRFLATIGLPPALPKDGESTNTVTGIRSVFFPAYIDVVDANAKGFNPRKRIPFCLNATMGYMGGGVYDDAKDLNDGQLFWAHTAVFGYQAETTSDMDPNTEGPLLGITLKKKWPFEGGISAVCVESIRDASIDRSYQNQISNPQAYPAIRSDYWFNFAGIVAHEVGHAPGGHGESSDHDEGDLMEGQRTHSIQRARFAPVTIKRFRGVSEWGGNSQ